MIRDDVDGPEPLAKDIDYNKVLSTIFSRWYWVAVSVFAGLLLAWTYLSLKHPQYRASASLMLKERSSDIARILNSDAADNTTIETFNLSQSAIFIIQSEAFLNKAISRLNYRYSFYEKDKWSYNSLYPESPFTINIISQDTTDYFSRMFKVVARGGGKFSLSVAEDQSDTGKVYQYGAVIRARGISFKVLNSFAVRNREYYFRFDSKESLMARTMRSLEINAQNLNILEISHTDANAFFAAKILNAIADEYIVYESAQRNLSALQRIAFINSQLDILGKKVDSIGNELDSIKKINGIANGFPAKIQIDINRLTTYEGQRSQLDFEKLNIRQLEEQAQTNGTKLVINFSLQGQVDATLGAIIAEYNTRLAEREDLLLRYQPNSSQVLAIENKLAGLRTAILYNIRQMDERNTDRQRFMDAKIAESKAILNEISPEARDFIRFQAEYDINKKILSNFTEEKYKSQIEQSAIAPGASIIYYAVPPAVPAYPIPKRIYALAILAGGGAGLFFIILARYLSGRLQDLGSVLKATNIPVLGVIRRARRKYYGDTGIPVAYFSQSGSIFAESVRKVRNSLVFRTNKTKAKVICISSEISGEGRSFVAINLAASLSQLNKRVIIIDADLRKPSLDKTLSTDEIGLSAYLINYKSLLSIINHTGIKNLDIIPSGIAPSNAADLLLSSKMKELIAYVRNIYDYIIIDTSPVGTFADAIPLLEGADLNLFILRGGFSRNKSIQLLEKISSEYQLNNFYIVSNAFKKNPLYQPFDSNIDTDVYFNGNYSGYTRKFDANSDDLKWDHLKKRMQ